MSKHGMSYSPEYRVWVGMLCRCYYPVTHGYSRYGGRGITVCEKWSASFSAFFHDMGVRPSNEHTLERIDNMKGYTPENCRWATRKEQSRNRQTNLVLTFKGKTQVATDWAIELNIPPMTLFQRLHRKWSIEKAFTTPVRAKN